MIKYFTPKHQQSPLERQKSQAFIFFMICAFILLFILLYQALFPKPDFSVSDYFIPVAQVFVVITLFYHKNHGFKKAGNIFSIGCLVIVAIVINYFDGDTLVTKYSEEFYLAITLLVFASFFASRRILLITGLVIFLSSFQVYFHIKDNYDETQTEKLDEAQLFFSVTIILITLILFFATKFADRAIENALKDSRIKERQNKALELAQKRLSESELLYRSIVNNLFGGFYKLDENRRIVIVSPSVSRITGYKESDLLGNNFSLFFNDPLEETDFWKQVTENGNVELFQSSFQTSDNRIITIETNATLIQNGEGIIQGIEGIFYDITEKKAMQIELESHRNNLQNLVDEKTQLLTNTNKELTVANDELSRKTSIIDKKNRELNSALQDLKEAQSRLVQSEKMASLGILTSGVAHELNNPLNFINGSLITLRQYFQKELPKDESIDTTLNYLELGLDRASSIVSGLTQFSRSHDHFEEECDIHEVIDNALLMLSKQYEPRIKVVKQFTKEGKLILGDKGKLHQVFVNLLMNSIQAIKESGTISIQTDWSDQFIVVCISDDGIGINKEDLSKVTDPFFTTKDPGHGTGLGLSITYTIIKEHKGEMEFKSEEDIGTTVTIKLPSGNNHPA